MLKISRIVLPIIIVVLAGYVFISENNRVMPYIMFLMGALLLVAGIIEIKQQERRLIGIYSVVVSLSIFYVIVQIFIL